MDKKMYFLSGLPRTGSTLFRAVLNQNPRFHTEGISSVCHLLGTVDFEVETTLRPVMQSVGRYDLVPGICDAMIDAYYAGVERPVILDKHRLWTLGSNLSLIKKYITPNPKIVVMIRPFEEIFASYFKLYERAGKTKAEANQRVYTDLMTLEHQAVGVSEAMQNNYGEYLFVEYSDFIESPAETMKSVYDFFGEEQFIHNFSSVSLDNKEDDSVFNVDGIHEIRGSFSKDEEESTYPLPSNLVDIAGRFNKLIGYSLEYQSPILRRC